MLDEELEPESTSREIRGVQLSLAELFFITTLCAVAFWLHIYVSPFIALLAEKSSIRSQHHTNIVTTYFYKL